MAKHITNDDRHVIESMWRAGDSCERIADRIGVSYSSMAREIKRGFDGTALSPGRCGYSAAVAIRDAEYKQSLMDAGRRKARERRLLRRKPDRREAM